MTLFGKNRDLAKNRRDKQAESGAVNDQTGVRRNQYGGMREGVRNRRTERAARVAEKASNRQAEGKNLSKRQQRLSNEHNYNVGRDTEIARNKYEKTQTSNKPKVETKTNVSPVKKTTKPAVTTKSKEKKSYSGGHKVVDGDYTRKISDKEFARNENTRKSEASKSKTLQKGSDYESGKLSAAETEKVSEARRKKGWSSDKNGRFTVRPRGRA
tara:strand:- start:90 stop:728 length:639 start_codon:yes stop_codon:yes gene_type:complete